MSAHKRLHKRSEVFLHPDRDGRAAWSFVQRSGALSPSYRTTREARLAARQDANRLGYEWRRELAVARQKAEEAEKQAREAGRKAEARRPGLLSILGAPPTMGPRGQGHGAIYGPIKQGTRQRTRPGKGRR
jgi:hypothetical protein